MGRNYSKDFRQTVSAESEESKELATEFEPILSWSHYCELLKVENPLLSENKHID